MRGRAFRVMGAITILFDLYLIYDMMITQAWETLPPGVSLSIQINIILWLFVGFSQVAVGYLLDQEHKSRKD